MDSGVQSNERSCNRAEKISTKAFISSISERSVRPSNRFRWGFWSKLSVSREEKCFVSSTRPLRLWKSLSSAYSTTSSRYSSTALHWSVECCRIMVHESITLMIRSSRYRFLKEKESSFILEASKRGKKGGSFQNVELILDDIMSMVEQTSCRLYFNTGKLRRGNLSFGVYGYLWVYTGNNVMKRYSCAMRGRKITQVSGKRKDWWKRRHRMLYMHILRDGFEGFEGNLPFLRKLWESVISDVEMVYVKTTEIPELMTI